MMRFQKVALIAMILMSLTGCETRSKLVAKNVYSQPQSYASLCRSRRSVELRQLTKNSSLALMPVAAVLSGGMSVLFAATVNGITLDDEISNRIAENCELQEYKNNADILVTMALTQLLAMLS